jgi:Flp pilus assembly protein TadG
MVKKRHKKGASGTVLMEFIMAFPIVLTLMLAVVQFAHICIARQVVHYAAYSAARAAMVTTEVEAPDDAKEAAARICSAITLSESLVDYNARTSAAGGDKQAFNAARNKTIVTVDFNDWNITATVKHQFGLVVPIVGQMLGWGFTLWGDNAYQEQRNALGAGDAIHYPHITLTETVLMSKPYKTVVAAEQP